MTRAERRFKSEIKDLKRRHLYMNHAINGRFEVSDESVEIRNGYANSKAGRSTLDPRSASGYKRLKNGEGHWSQYPKNKYYGAEGYRRKHRTVKERILDDIEASQE